MSSDESSNEYESSEEEQSGSGSEEEESGSEEESEESEEEEEVVAKPVKKRGRKPKKDPNKPKRNMSAFFLYSNAERANVKANNPDIPFGEVAKILSQQFKALPEKEVKKWQKKADKDKIRYQEEMKNYTPPSDSDSDSDAPRGKKKKKAAKDPNKPKRNQSAYFIYSTTNRARVKKENPDASFGDIAKIISAEFKELDDKEKKVYQKKADKDKIRYQEEMKAYNKRR